MSERGIKVHNHSACVYDWLKPHAGEKKKSLEKKQTDF